MATNFTTYLPLNEAAERYDIPQETLHTALEEGTLCGAQLPDGELLVAIEDVQVLAEQLEPVAMAPLKKPQWTQSTLRILRLQLTKLLFLQRVLRYS